MAGDGLWNATLALAVNVLGDAISALAGSGHWHAILALAIGRLWHVILALASALDCLATVGVLFSLWLALSFRMLFELRLDVGF